jgi:UDP-N-acetylglucosamine transferase subunit ALG13
VILVAVGTFIHGFDELVAAADQSAAELRLPGFAQIGHSRVIPEHLAWEGFVPPEALADRMAQAHIVVCHGGIGVLGEAMRAGKPIIAMPRRGRPTRASPAGDQLALVQRLAERHGIGVCEAPHTLIFLLRAQIVAGWPSPSYDLGTDVPRLVARFLIQADVAGQ